MDVIIEIVAELLFQLVVEVLGAVGRKGLANVLARPWLQLVVSMAGAVGAGFAWTRLVRPDTLPLLVTSIVGPSGCCPRWWAIEPWEASGSPAPGWVRSPRSVRPTRQGAGSACSERVTPLA